ncbi:MAG: hypothetical protein ACOYL3_06420 [Desulfuromonadaceae bacterium]
MKKSEKIRFLRQGMKISIFIFMLLSVPMCVFAEEVYVNDIRPRGIYATAGVKKMPANSQGSGISYGGGWKKGIFGMEIYQTNFNSMPKGMSREYSNFGGGGSPIPGKKVISEAGFGFDFNFYMQPISGFKRLELYGGPSMAFERESEVWVKQNGIEYADGNAIWKTKFGGQAGIIVHLPLGSNQNLAICAGFSSYRGVTTGLGFTFQ